MNLSNVLIRPFITEKSMREAGMGKFTFIVATTATKYQIADVVEQQFKVDVLKVQTITTKGRTQRVGKRRTEQTMAAFKKAIVTLKKGQKIDMFEVPEEKKDAK